jgi:glycosyl hydrolase family 38
LDRHLVIVPHTHWDREWYQTHEQFRVRLVRLLDGLLSLLEGDPGFRHFMLDGQTIVLDDYLEVRPEARERIEKLVRDGRLVIGPWYVLPDEWLVSGEALIRNLRLGLRKASMFGAGMRIGYVPDQFGHVGQLPQIFRGFGFDGAVLWRGVPAEIAQTCFLWEASDGSAIFSAYLPRGYGNAALLPLDPEGLVDRLAREIKHLEPFARISTLLLMNGSDHREPQPGLPAALEAASAKLPGVTLEMGTLADYLIRAKKESGRDLPVYRGELRSGLRAPLLPGCASARAPQKQADFRNDRLLTRYLEPLASWLSALGGEFDGGLLDLAWRIALENHPHDSICGCSVDRVHAQMESRFQRVEEIATAQLETVAGQLAARVAAPAPPAGRPGGEVLVVWNPNAAGRAQVDSALELYLPGEVSPRQSVPLHLRAADGRRVATQATVETEGSVWGGTFPTSLALSILPGFGREVLGYFVNDLVTRVEGNRLVVSVRLGSAPEGELDVLGRKRELAAALSAPGIEEVAVEARRPPRVRLRFVDDFPGHGLRVYSVARGRSRAEDRVFAERSAMGGARIKNGFWQVEASAKGDVTLTRLTDGTAVRDALRLVSEGDRGDEYNFDPIRGAAAIERPHRARVRVLGGAGPEIALAIELRYRVPGGLTPDRMARSEKHVELPARVLVRLASGLDRVDVEVTLHNTAKDHRMRLHVRAPFAAQRFEVESAFEVAKRPIAPQPSDFGSPHPAEFPIGACPERAFATISDGTRALTVANRGTSEVEAVREAEGTTSLALTLLRAVGWLSQGGLGLRPGPAGPPFPTPEAQMLGSHRAEFALFSHSDGDPMRVARAHAFAYPPIAFVRGGGGDATLGDQARLVEIDDPEVVVSAIEPDHGGGPKLRIYEATGRARSVTVRWHGSTARMLVPVDLTGRPSTTQCAPTPDGVGAVVPLRPWQILTLAVR